MKKRIHTKQEMNNDQIHSTEGSREGKIQVKEVNTSMRPNGTLPDRFEMVDDKMAEVLRNKSPLDRLRIGGSLWESARVFLGAHLGKTHPEWSEEEIQQEINRRFLYANP